jgi:hypothetical protein
MGTTHRQLPPAVPSLLACALFAAGASLAVGAETTGDPRLPDASPSASSSQVIGVTRVSVDYHRPAVRDRKIWGELVPFDQVWRLGANQATTVTFEDAVRIGTTDVPAGKYALFAIPGRERFTFVVNREADQWGAFRYRREADVVRVEVPTERGATTEWMSLVVTPTGEGRGAIEFAWADVRAALPFTVDVRRIVWASLDRAMAADAEEHLSSAARYAEETGERVETALGWIDRVIAQHGERAPDLATKAGLLARSGKGAEAVALYRKAIELATRDRVPPDYIAGLERRIAQIQR